MMSAVGGDDLWLPAQRVLPPMLAARSRAEWSVRTLTAMADVVVGLAGDAGRPRTTQGNDRDTSLVPPSLDDGVPPACGPPCVIDWTDQFARVEADLRTVMLITVFGSVATSAINDLEMIKTAVASSFNLDWDTMVL